MTKNRIKKCKICNNKSISVIYNEKLKKSYNYCPKCQFISLFRHHIASKKDQIDRYLLHNNNSKNENYINYLSAIISKIPLKPDFNNALDFGCGPNPVLKELLKTKFVNIDIYDKYFFPKNQKIAIFSNDLGEYVI